MAKHKLLIVGSFPFLRKDYKDNTFHGGIVTSSKVIIDNLKTEKFRLIPLDSSQNSLHPPGKIGRAYGALKRIITLISLLVAKKPDAALIFASDGWSAIEKGFMIWICNCAKCETLIFPRAGNLIQQTRESKIMLGAIKRLFSYASIFLCQGPSWKRYALETLGFSEKRVHTINNWTATEEKLEIGSLRNYEANPSPVHILFVGWVEEFKGVFDLLTACLVLKESKLDFKLTLAGDGSAFKDANEFVQRHDLGRHIEFAGWVESTDLDKLLKSGDIFVLPSWSEGLPNAMIEAMAAGLAVVVTSVGVVPDFIESNQNGILIPPRSPEELSRALRTLLTDKAFRVRLASNGRLTAMKKFAAKQSIAELSSVVEQLSDRTN